MKLKHPFAPALLAVLFCIANGLPAVRAQTTAAGKLEKGPYGITLTTATGVTRVELWTERVVRVTHLPADPAPLPPSLSVVARPQEFAWQLADGANEAILTTGQLEVHVEKSTGRVRFLEAKGQPILSEVENGATVSSAAVEQQFVLTPGEAIYGLGQHQDGAMNYVGTSVRLLQENMKVAVPVLLSSLGYAVLWDNPAVTDVDVGKTDKAALAWRSEAGAAVDYYFLAGPEPDQAIAGYRWLTGAAPMFPRWAWGFWQSRERYKTQEELLGIAAEYRRRGLPLDALIQDWQFWPPLNQETAEGGWGSHEFDPARYPDPAAMIKALHEQHVHLMLDAWPKFDMTNHGVSIPNLQALEAVHGAYEPAMPFVYPPGRGKWYDPFNDQARSVYWDQLAKHGFALGADAWWLDASEPELSGQWGEFRGYTTAKGLGSVVFNAYPLEHTRAVYEGQRGASSAKRVVLLTRSAYAGQQRNGAITWSGDIHGKWEVLQRQIPAGLNFTASGIPYWNTDIGGFFSTKSPDPKYTELFTRWFQFGAFCPMFRVHGTDQPKEVWRFDEKTQGILADYLNLRYHLLPYIYSVSWMVTNEGYTMMRPLVMDFRQDAATQGIGDEFMFGPALLAAPVTAPGAQERGVYLPAGTRWTDFWTGQSYDGGQKITAAAPVQTMPIFVRAGSVLPYGPTIQYADQITDAPTELRIYGGADGRFTLYEDAGDSYDYEHGAYATVPITWNEHDQTLTIEARRGTFPGLVAKRAFSVVYVSGEHGAGTAPVGKADFTVEYTGAKVIWTKPAR